MRSASIEIDNAALHRQARELVEALGGDWRASAAMCRCPAHDDGTPSLSIRVGAQSLLFHCFAGCSGTDVIRSLRRGRLLSRVPLASACATMTLKADRSARRRAGAQTIWNEARPMRGSLAERYLSDRGLADQGGSLRFHPRTPHGSGPTLTLRPALIAAVRDETGLVAVHRTFLDPTGGKAEIPAPKMALGALGQGAVRLAPAADILGLAEGIENALAASILFGVPVWAVLGNLRFGLIALPPLVSRLLLFTDNDAGGTTAKAKARAAHDRPGRLILTYAPPAPRNDWNDVLLARTASDRS